MGLFNIATAAVLTVGLAQPASKIYQEQLDIINSMGDDYPDTDYTVTWDPCGELNSAYWMKSHRIELCTEVSDEPRVAGFFAAHEMSHAVIIQGVGDESEEGADEFAAVWLLTHGHEDAVTDAVGWMMEQDQGHSPGDDHPGWRFREWNLICMTAGYNDDKTPGCRAYWLGKKAFWEARMTLDLFED